MPGIEIKGRSKIANYRHGGRTRKFGGGRTNLLEQLGRVEAERSNPNRRAEISRVHGELNRGYAKGGVVRRAKKFKTHGKDVPTMAAEGGRAGHAAGSIVKSIIKGGKKIISKIKGKGEKGLGSGIKPSEMHEIIPKGDRKLYLKEKLANPHKRIGKAEGGWTKILPKGPRGGHPGFTKESMYERWGGGEKGKPHSSKEGRIAGGERNMRRQRERMKERLKKWKEDNPPRAKLPSPGRPQAPSRPKRPNNPGWPKGYDPVKQQDLSTRKFKKGGKADKKWIQKAVDPKHKGYCTPMTKKTCTPARKALARTFKKKAKTGWG